MKKNDVIELNITDISAEGSGVGRYENLAVFVPLTAVGDLCRVHILKVKKSYAFARLLEIIEPSHHRTQPDCPVFNKCGGCTLRHMDYTAELQFKSNRVYECIKRIGGVDLKPQPTVALQKRTRYRNKAQYPVSLSGQTGFYALHSHRIIPCDDCLIQPKEFSAATAELSMWIRKNNISVYDEASHRGLVRHFYMRKAEVTGEIMAVLVINGDSVPFADELVHRLKTALGSSLCSVQININTEDTNVVLGNKNITIYGNSHITDILCGIKVRLSPLSFYQVNRAMAEKLYEKAAEYALPDGADILDLYCGAGTIGLSMAHRAKSVVGVEIVPQAVEDALQNAKQNNIQNARFICSDATVAAARLKDEGFHPKTVIVDPPRKGCSEALINTITYCFSPERLVYISCDPATLARDTALLEQRGYHLIEYTPFDLFPGTVHIETAAYFTR